MLDWEDSNGSSGSDDDNADVDMSGLRKAVTNLREAGTLYSQKAMHGLQLALTEGWLITKARDMCSFAHDRYRQAAQAEVDSLPQASIAKMSFKVSLHHILVNPSIATNNTHTDRSDDVTRYSIRESPNC